MYGQISIWGKIVGAVTWIFLLMLVPLSVLGYFSENSVPGNALYPMKREIENIVLALESLNKSSQALYQLQLADRRFNEAETLLATKSNVKQLKILPLENFTNQIDSAKTSMNNISDTGEKKKTLETLLNNISTYQTRLEQLQSVYQIVYPTSQITKEQQTNQQIATNIYQTKTTLQQDQIMLQQAVQNISNGGSGIIPTVAILPTISYPQISKIISPTLSISPTVTVSTNPSPASCSCYINGFPFIDSNYDGSYDNGESYYYNNSDLTFSLYDKNGNFITSQSQNNGQTQNTNWFSFNKLVPGTYTVTLNSPPPAYHMTTSQSWTVKIGNQCDIGGNKDAKCGYSGDIIGIDFGFVHNGNGQGNGYRPDNENGQNNEH